MVPKYSTLGRKEKCNVSILKNGNKKPNILLVNVKKPTMNVMLVSGEMKGVFVNRIIVVTITTVLLYCRTKIIALMDIITRHKDIGNDIFGC